MAQSLDLKCLQLTGDAFPIAELVGFYLGASLGTFSASDNGVLTFRGGGGDRQLVWFDRAAKVIERVGPPKAFFDIALSPDQKRAAIQNADPNQDILVVDLLRGVASRLTSHLAIDDWPVWSPDGSHILFNSTRNGPANMYQKLSSGAGDEELLIKSATPNNPTDWSRDGRFILFEKVDPKTGSDIWVWSLAEKKEQAFLQTQFAEQHARFSPDGKWVAYVSNENGPEQVWVQTFPPSGGKWQISANGGITPRWRGDGKELFYIAPDRKIMSVEVKAGPNTFEVTSPKALFEAPFDSVSPASTNRYDVAPDGQRFLVNAPAENTTTTPITIVVNWLAGVNNGR